MRRCSTGTAAATHWRITLNTGSASTPATNAEPTSGQYGRNAADSQNASWATVVTARTGRSAVPVHEPPGDGRPGGHPGGRGRPDQPGLQEAEPHAVHDVQGQGQAGRDHRNPGEQPDEQKDTDAGIRQHSPVRLNGHCGYLPPPSILAAATDSTKTDIAPDDAP